MPWSKPKDPNLSVVGETEKKVDFGPRINRSAHKIPTVLNENEKPSNTLGNNSYASASSKIAYNDMEEKLKVVERERDDWKLRCESVSLRAQENLGDMLVEIELETLRDEVGRLRALLGSMSENAKSDVEKELMSQRLRCAELENQVEILKKEKLLLEQKNKDTRNAEISRVRALQEQITNERKLRERMANTESSLPVVTVGPPPGCSGESQTHVITIKPRSASSAVPSFVAEPVSVGRPSGPAVDPKNLAATKVVLPSMKAPTSPKSGIDSLGNDFIAEQWKEFLKDKPVKWKQILSRDTKTNEFKFGSMRIACKKLGNQTMIHFGSETMLIEKFIETYGPKEGGPDPMLKVSAPQLANPQVTLKKR